MALSVIEFCVLRLILWKLIMQENLRLPPIGPKLQILNTDMLVNRDDINYGLGYFQTGHQQSHIHSVIDCLE